MRASPIECGVVGIIDRATASAAELFVAVLAAEWEGMRAKELLGKEAGPL